MTAAENTPETAAVLLLKRPAARWPDGASLAELMQAAAFPPPGDERPRRAVEVAFAAALTAAGWRRNRQRSANGRRGTAWLPPKPPARLPALTTRRGRPEQTTAPAAAETPPPTPAQEQAAARHKAAGRALAAIQRPARRWPGGVSLAEVQAAAGWPGPDDPRPERAAAADFAFALAAAGWTKLPPRRVDGRLARLWQPPPEPPPGLLDKAKSALQQRGRPAPAPPTAPVRGMASALFNTGDRHSPPELTPPMRLPPPRQRRRRRR